jgi:predicted  nucleic acid-binding Zn-ribbon protein
MITIIISVLKEKNESLQKQLVWSSNDKSSLNDNIKLLNDQVLSLSTRLHETGNDNTNTINANTNTNTIL